MKKILGLCLCLFTLWLAGCGEKQQTDEDLLRAWATQATAAASEKSITQLKGLIAENYQNSEGQTRNQLLLQLHMLFNRYGKVGLKTHIEEVEVMAGSPKSGRVVAVVDMSENPALAQLGFAQTRYQFVLLLNEYDGKWLLTSSRVNAVNQ